MKNSLKLLAFTLGVGSAFLSANVSASTLDDVFAGYCDGPDTTICKITAEGSTAMGTWVETDKEVIGQKNEN